MVADVVTTSGAQEGDLRGPVQRLVGRLVHRGAGGVRAQAGGGLLGGVVLRSGGKVFGEIQWSTCVIFGIIEIGEMGGVFSRRGQGGVVMRGWGGTMVQVPRVEGCGPTKTRVVATGQIGRADPRVRIMVVRGKWLWLRGRPQHVGIVRGKTGGVRTVGQAVLKPALDHVVVVQPAVRLHHHSLLLAAITEKMLKMLKMSGMLALQHS